MNLFEFTRELINIPSITGSEAELGRFLVSYLESLDYSVELQEISTGRANVIAATARPPRVVLSTHMDTVPPQIATGEDEEYIYGRGACDAKGIIAAQIFAAEQLRSEGLDEVGLLFTVDEEAGSEGARAANANRLASSCRYLINGEPTDNKLATGTKGSLRFRIKTEGRAAHSAYPEVGKSAIETLLDVLNDIRNYGWPADEFFGETTCNIGTISGGVRSNVVPAAAEAELQIRLTTPASTIERVLSELLRGRAEIEYLSVSEPLKLLSIDGFDTCVVRFTTDIPCLSNWGTPLLLGPGSILDAHTDHERVAKRDLTEAVSLYAKLVRMLLARAPEEIEQQKAEGAGD